MSDQSGIQGAAAPTLKPSARFTQSSSPLNFGLKRPPMTEPQTNPMDSLLSESPTSESQSVSPSSRFMQTSGSNSGPLNFGLNRPTKQSEPETAVSNPLELLLDPVKEEPMDSPVLNLPDISPRLESFPTPEAPALDVEIGFRPKAPPMKFTQSSGPLNFGLKRVQKPATAEAPNINDFLDSPVAPIMEASASLVGGIDASIFTSIPSSQLISGVVPASLPHKDGDAGLSLIKSFSRTDVKHTNSKPATLTEGTQADAVVEDQASKVTFEETVTVTEVEVEVTATKKKVPSILTAPSKGLMRKTQSTFSIGSKDSLEEHNVSIESLKAGTDSPSSPTVPSLTNSATKSSRFFSEPESRKFEVPPSASAPSSNGDSKARMSNLLQAAGRIFNSGMSPEFGQTTNSLGAPQISPRGDKKRADVKLHSKVTAWEMGEMSMSGSGKMQPVLKRRQYEWRSGLPNELRRSFAMFDTDRGGSLSISEVEHAHALLTSAGVAVDEAAVGRLKLDITMKYNQQGMRFVDFIDYLSDDKKRASLQSFIDSESVDQLVSKVQDFEMDWFVYIRLVISQLFLPIFVVLYWYTDNRAFLPFSRSQHVEHQQFKLSLLLTTHLAVFLLPVFHYLWGDGVLSWHEVGAPIMYQLVIIFCRAFDCASVFPGSEVASRLQKCVLDRTPLKLPYDEDITTAGMALKLLLERYLEERTVIQRWWIYRYGHFSEVIAMASIATLHLCFAAMDRVLFQQNAWFGRDPIETFIVLVNMMLSFVTFSICLSYLNIGRIKLTAKLLRTKLFDSLADVNAAVDKRLPFISLHNANNLEGWWRLRLYLQHGRSEDAKSARSVEGTLAHLLIADLVCIAIITSGLLFLRRGFGMWMALPLYDAVILTGLLLSIIVVGVNITKAQNDHMQLLVGVQLQESLSALTQTVDPEQHSKWSNLLRAMVEAIRDYDEPMHVLLFPLNADFLNSLISYIGTLAITLLSFALSSFLPD